MMTILDYKENQACKIFNHATQALPATFKLSDPEPSTLIKQLCLRAQESGWDNIFTIGSISGILAASKEEKR